MNFVKKILATVFTAAASFGIFLPDAFAANT